MDDKAKELLASWLKLQPPFLATPSARKTAGECCIAMSALSKVAGDPSDPEFRKEFGEQWSAAVVSTLKPRRCQLIRSNAGATYQDVGAIPMGVQWGHHRDFAGGGTIFFGGRYRETAAGRTKYVFLSTFSFPTQAFSLQSSSRS